MLLTTHQLTNLKLKPGNPWPPKPYVSGKTGLRQWFSLGVRCGNLLHTEVYVVSIHIWGSLYFAHTLFMREECWSFV